MKKAVLLLTLVFVLLLGGCSNQNANTGGEFMPEVKNTEDIFEIYDYSQQKLIKSIDMSSGDEELLICDSIVNNVDTSVNYLSSMDSQDPEYLLLYCGKTQDECIYIKIRFSEGKLYRQIYGASEKALTLDQGILECITVTEEDFRSILE